MCTGILFNRRQAASTLSRGCGTYRALIQKSILYDSTTNQYKLINNKKNDKEKRNNCQRLRIFVIVHGSWYLQVLSFSQESVDAVPFVVADALFVFSLALLLLRVYSTSDRIAVSYDYCFVLAVFFLFLRILHLRASWILLCRTSTANRMQCYSGFSDVHTDARALNVNSTATHTFCLCIRIIRESASCGIFFIYTRILMYRYT